MKILLVDDHIIFREGLSGAIKAQPDFEVIGEVSTAQEAIEVSQRCKPDVIVMDFPFPDGSVVDAARSILKDSPQVKILFLTVHDTDECLFAAVQCGAKGFLLKTTPTAKLLRALRAVYNGEAALPRKMVSRILDEFSQLRESKPDGDLIAELTFREIEILRHLATGATNREIADRLVITENTVKNHVHNILEKLELRNRREVARFAQQHGLLSSDL